MIRFVWNRLAHVPCPSTLVFIIYHGLGYLLDSRKSNRSNHNENSVQILVCAFFDDRYLSSHFSYQGRDIATPYLSCLNLEDPINDWRLLGNTVYSPSRNRYNLWRFRDFFTGSEELGFYEFDDSPFHRTFRSFWEEYYLSRYVDFGYHVVDLVSRKRISESFDNYREAEEFAKKLFYGDQSKVEGVRFVPHGYFLKLNVVLAHIRKLGHPIGFFSYIKAQTGVIYASELFHLFRDILMRGGEIVD